MNEKAEQLITDAGEKILSYLEATEGFAVEQAPLLAQEIVRYGILNNSLQIALFVILIPSLVYLSYKFGKSNGAWEWDDTPKPSGIACILFGIAGFFSFVAGLKICTSDAIPNLCKALIAPRLYIIEQIGRLM